MKICEAVQAEPWTQSTTFSGRTDGHESYWYVPQNSNAMVGVTMKISFFYKIA